MNRWHNENNGEPLLTVQQAADKLGISPKHFRREFINPGRIAVISLGKSARGDRIQNCEIEKLIENRKQVKCQSICEVKLGGSKSRSTVKQYADPLGLPRNAKH